MNVCATGNGGCSHTCIHTAHNEYKCECDPGFVLHENKHFCVGKITSVVLHAEISSMFMV